MPPTLSTDSPVNLNISKAALCVIAAGLAARIYLFYQIPGINPDSYLYIQQAKALYFGIMDQILSCYVYLSPYPMAVTAVYPIFGDWVAAARIVNILFSTLAIVVFYWLFHRFFEDPVASLTALIFALLPPLIWVSVDGLRDPMFWFFSVTGLYLFILHIEKSRPWVLLCCSICLGLAAWARIEGALYILIAALYLPFLKTKNNWTESIIFFIPYLFLLLLVVVIGFTFKVDWVELFDPERILNLPRAVISQYGTIRHELHTLYRPEVHAISPYFFDRIRNLVWIIALVALIVLIVEALFYVFSIVLVVGAISLKKNIWQDRRIRYLSLVCVSSMVLLYFHTLSLWHSAPRHLAVFLLPAFIFIAAGIGRCHSLLLNRFSCKPATSYFVLLAVVILAFVPKILRANFDKDNLTYQEIGHYISQREGGLRAVSVCGALKQLRDIHFYANLDTRFAPCLDDGAHFYETNLDVLDLICDQHYDYLVWDQKGWKNQRVDSLPSNLPCGFNKIREWRSEKLGQIILYEVVK